MNDILDRSKAKLEGITPGQWVVDQHAEDDHGRVTVGAATYLESPGNYTSTDLIHEVDTCGIELDSKDYARILADARLIAAAPRLIAELVAEVERLRGLACIDQSAADVDAERAIEMCPRGHGQLENGDCPDCGYAT